jgi:hypothetical protein
LPVHTFHSRSALPNKYDFGFKVLKILMEWTRGTYGDEERCVKGSDGKFEGKVPLGRPKSRLEMILKWILEKYNGEREMIWPMSGESGRLL